MIVIIIINIIIITISFIIIGINTGIIFIIIIIITIVIIITKIIIVIIVIIIIIIIIKICNSYFYKPQVIYYSNTWMKPFLRLRNNIPPPPPIDVVGVMVWLMYHLRSIFVFERFLLAVSKAGYLGTAGPDVLC